MSASPIKSVAIIGAGASGDSPKALITSYALTPLQVLQLHQLSLPRLSLIPYGSSNDERPLEEHGRLTSDTMKETSDDRLGYTTLIQVLEQDFILGSCHLRSMCR